MVTLTWIGLVVHPNWLLIAHDLPCTFGNCKTPEKTENRSTKSCQLKLTLILNSFAYLVISSILLLLIVWFWIVRFTRRYLLLTSILTFISAIYLKYIWTYPRFNWTKHQKIWKNSKLQDTVDGRLLSYLMLLAILDGSLYKKSQKWLQQRPSTIKFRSISILTIDLWYSLQVSILNHRAMVVICKIFGNGCHPKCPTIWHMIKDDHQWSTPSKLNFWCFANFSMFGSIKFCMDSNEFCIE